MKKKQPTKIDQQFLDENALDCPMCLLSTDHELLGVLGRLLHVRCRGCGWTFAFRIKEEK